MILQHPASESLLECFSEVPKTNGRKVDFYPEEFYTPFLSTLAKERRPSPIRCLFHLEGQPDMISLLAGKPNPETFPFTSISFTARSPTDTSVECSYDITGQSLANALQYSATDGFPGLVEWFVGLQEYSHARKKGTDWQVAIGAGSQDLLYKAFHALLNDGDPILIESPAYAGVIPILRSLHCNLIEVETDTSGVSAVSLCSILDTWPAEKCKPRILYTVPCGCNPTGITTTLERRLEILKVARAHNVLILEDDPYYYLYFGSRPRPPSFFALEALDGGPTGLVLRFDSLSKVLSAGIRIGAISGPEPLVRVIEMHTSNSNLQVSSLTQVLAYTLLSSWGYDGFRKHTENISALYCAKRDVFEFAMRKHLDGLIDWVTPDAGMFFWLKLHLPPSPGACDGDSEVVMRTKALENGVLALPGAVFIPTKTKTTYVRASFSLLEKEQVEEALIRLAHVIRQAQEAL